MASDVNPRPATTRRYDSPRRTQQAAATRAAILEAAQRLFERDGYASTTMAAIAGEAGVASKTVYLAFDTKGGVVRGVWDVLLRGPDRSVADTPWYQEVLDEPDPRQALGLNARNSRVVKERLGRLLIVIREAAAVDDDMASLWHLIESDFYANQRAVVASLAARRDGLRDGLDVDRAADLLWTLNHPENWRLLVVVRGWSPADYQSWLAEASCSQLLGAPNRPRRDGPPDIVGDVPLRSPIVPAVVHNRAVAVGAERWLRELPALLAELEAEWGFVTGATYPDATEAYVAAATLADGTPAVLKLLVPRDGQLARQEIEVLRRTDGDGCARLLRHDASRDALLLERLGRSLSQLGLPIERRHEILCATAARCLAAGARHVAPLGRDTGASVDRRHAHALGAARPAVHGTRHRPRRRLRRSAHLGPRRRACRARARRRAPVEHARSRRRVQAGRSRRAPRRGRVRPRDHHAGGSARTAHRRPARSGSVAGVASGLDARAIWEWGVIERTSNGLLCLRDGLRPAGDEMLVAADRLAAFEW